MKTPRIANAISHIDDELVTNANRARAVKKNFWLKWGSIAAGFMVLAAAAVITPMMFGSNQNSFLCDDESRR